MEVNTQCEKTRKACNAQKLERLSKYVVRRAGTTTAQVIK
jgi:hypothetical protein